jgi:hypothetical protein
MARVLMAAVISIEPSRNELEVLQSQALAATAAEQDWGSVRLGEILNRWSNGQMSTSEFTRATAVRPAPGQRLKGKTDIRRSCCPPGEAEQQGPDGDQHGDAQGHGER